MANEAASPVTSKAGPICRMNIEKGQGNYLANLALYPGTHFAAMMLANRMEPADASAATQAGLSLPAICRPTHRLL